MKHLLLTLLWTLPLLAQTRSSSVRIEVLDPQNRPIAAAEVDLQSPLRGVSRRIVASEEGVAVFPGLEVGEYRVSVRAQGFAPSAPLNVALTLDRQVSVQLTLQVAGSATEVDVKGTIQTLETAVASTSGLITREQIQELPLNGRDYVQLAVTQPGVHLARAQSRDGNVGFGIPLSIGGGRPVQNNYRMDGVSLTNQTGATPGSLLGLNLGLEAIQEFTLVSGVFSASQGRSAAGVVNVVTRSGTNDWGGSLFYYHRNSELDARNFFDGAQPPKFRRHQYGGSAGGPIRKNRTFVFGSLESVRDRQDVTTINTTLTADARAGRLLTGPVNVDPKIAPLLAELPLPNGQILGDTGLYSFANPVRARELFLTTRADQYWSERHFSFLRYSYDDADTEDFGNYQWLSRQNGTGMQSATLEDSFAFSPALLNVWRAGWVRTRANLGTASAARPALDSSALTSVPGAGAPIIIVPGLSDLPGGTGAPDAETSTFSSLQAYNDLQILTGRHTIKVGGNVEATRLDLNSTSVARGEFTFPSIALLLQNRADRFRAALPGTDTMRDFRQEVYAWYAHDTIRVTRSFALDLSLRHEWATVPRETEGRTANLINLTDSAMQTGKPFFRNPSYRNFGPRAGFAWDLLNAGKLVFRGGYGLYYDLILSPYLLLAGTRNPPFFVSADVRDLGLETFPTNAWNALVNRPQVSFRVERMDPNPAQPRVHQWLASLRYQLSNNMTLEAGYRGSRGANLSTLVEDANLVPGVLQSDGRLFFPANGTRINPSFGMIRNRLFNGQSFYNALQVQGIWRTRSGALLQGSYTWANSIDDDSSTFARTDASNSIGIPIDGIPDFNRGPSNHDIRHNFSLQALYPVRAFGPSWTRAIVGAWTISSLAVYNSGLPFTPVLGYDAARTGTSRPDYRGGQRPDLNPNFTGDIISGRPEQWFNPAAFLRPTPGYLGNLGRGVLRGPSLFSLDLGLTRQFQIGEFGRLNLRVEGFNITNHTNLDLPTAQRLTVFSRTGIPENTGRILSAAPPRRFQVGLHWRF